MKKSTREIRIAIVGVGNCASSLIQGFFYYKDLRKGRKSGLLHDVIGGYRPSDIRVVAAFDIDRRKIGKDISRAIFQKPNNTVIFCNHVPRLKVNVSRGPTLDGFPKHMLNFEEDVRFVESDKKPVDVVDVLRRTKPHILVNYLPVGSQKATEYYVDCCLKAGVSFINAIPVFICSRNECVAAFKKKGLVCVGDDIKAQMGATILHRAMVELFKTRGVALKRTYQLNTGGNTDFLNMLKDERLNFKKISKTEAIQSALDKPLDAKDIHVSPTDFVPWQKDNKISFIRLEGEIFGSVPMNVDLRLSVEDSPNSAGIMIDMIRCAKVALDNHRTGYLKEISAFGFKHPRVPVSDDKAIHSFSDFIKKHEA